jgi:ribosomal protein S18 acetylase RimI-like enzyme
MENVQFRSVIGESTDMLTRLARIDNEIPRLYDPLFKADEKMLDQRVKYFSELTDNDFFQAGFTGEEIVAFHLLQGVKSQNYVRVVTLWVRSDLRGRKIALTLKEMGEKWSIANGYDYIETEVNHNNPRMFQINERQGFEVVKLTMRKVLAKS